jgi:hypothetical protein
LLDCGDEGLAADDEAEPLRWYATPAEAAARLRTGALRWPPDAGDARGPLRPPDAGPFAAPFRDDGRVGPRRDGEAKKGLRGVATDRDATVFAAAGATAVSASAAAAASAGGGGGDPGAGRRREDAAEEAYAGDR